MRFCIAAVAVITTVAFTGLAGCGDESEAGTSEAYTAALEELKEVALSGGEYDVSRHDKELDKVQNQVLLVFCHLNDSLLIETGVKRHLEPTYYDSQIETLTGWSLDLYAPNRIREAMDELRGVMELPLNRDEAKRYAEACYPSVPPLKN